MGGYPHFTTTFPTNTSDPFFIDQSAPNTVMVASFNNTTVLYMVIVPREGVEISQR